MKYDKKKHFKKSPQIKVNLIKIYIIYQFGRITLPSNKTPSEVWELNKNTDKVWAVFLLM